MEDLATLITSFDFESIYPAIGQIAKIVGAFITPALLAIALMIRVMEVKLSGVATGQFRYGEALRDMITWTIVLSAYFAIGAVIVGFFNPIYAWIDSFGSIKATSKAFSDLMSKVVDAAQSGAGFKSILANLMDSINAGPRVIIGFVCYYFTLILVASLTVFLKIANILIFGLAFIWGLIAIPISISTTFRVLKGWAHVLAFALVWPIIQGVMVGLFSLPFTKSAQVIMSTAGTDPAIASKLAGVLLLFTVMHLILIAVLIAAPLITYALVANGNAAAGIVLPFTGAAAGAAIALFKGGKAAGQYGFGKMRGSSGGSGQGGGGGSSPQRRLGADAFGKAGGAAAGTTPGSRASPGEAGRKRAQQRRGTIIRQQLKKRGGTSGT